MPNSYIALSIREACAASSLGRTTIYSLINSGALRAVRVGGRTLIPADSLAALICEGHQKPSIGQRFHTANTHSEAADEPVR